MIRFQSRRITLIAWLAIASGCASQQGLDEQMPMPDYVAPPVGQPTTGAIYESGSSLRIFEDLRPSRVGDIITVRLVERTIAQQNSSTSTSKSTSAELDNPTVFGRPLTKDGDPLFTGSLGGEQSFDGEGSSNQSNRLDGDITVTVVERHPNGNLVVQGEKWVTINQGREFIRLSGVIRPFDIEPDNSIASGRVANAQITYSSKGVMAAANRMGLITRFFHSVLYPY
jgi:flagellar L-ring protein precursor FlgH